MRSIIITILKFLTNNLFAGVFASIVASFVFKHYSNGRKPNILISPNILKGIAKKEGKIVIIIKVVNQTPFDLTDIGIWVERLYDKGDGNVRVDEFSYSKIEYIRAYTEEDEGKPYARQIKMWNSNNIVSQIEDSDKRHTLRITLKAHCPEYGTTKIFHQIVENIVFDETSIFKQGISLEVESPQNRLT